VEALQLEYSWIKEFDPRYNVKYRDDKSYPYLAVTMSEEYPRVMVMRGAGTADAYATAAFAMGPAAGDWVESLDGYEALGIRPDGAAWRTSGFAAYTAAR
jgi:excinuclease UvrABC nuclease subunit